MTERPPDRPAAAGARRVAAAALVLLLATPVVGLVAYVAVGRDGGLARGAVVAGTLVAMGLLLGVVVIAGLAGSADVRVEVRGSGRRRSRRHRHGAGW